MVTESDFRAEPQQLAIALFQDFVALKRVRLHELPLFGCERRACGEIVVGDGELPNVVHRRRTADHFGFIGPRPACVAIIRQ